jgi:hypothetical protein
MLLSEAQDLVKEGPRILDLPTGAEGPFLRFWNPPEEWELDKIDHIADPKKRFFARSKFITGQKRPGRAETNLFEMLGQWARERSEPDISAYKEAYRELLSSPHIDFLPMIGLRNEFTEWKARSTRDNAAAAGKKSQKNRHSQKS